LGRSRRLALHPETAGTTLIDPAPGLHRIAEAPRAGPGQTQRHAVLVDDDRGPEAIGPIAGQRSRDRLGQREPTWVPDHTPLGVGGDTVGVGTLVGRGDATRDGGTGVTGLGQHPGGHLEVRAAQPTLTLGEGDQEAGATVTEAFDRVDEGSTGPLSP